MCVIKNRIQMAAGKRNLARAFNIANRAQPALTDVCIEFTCRKASLNSPNMSNCFFIIFGLVEMSFD